MISKRLERMKQYPPYRRWHSIAALLLGIGFALVAVSMCLSLMLGKDHPAVNVLGYAAIVCAVLYFLINFVYWRCPKCHKNLPVFGPVPTCRVCKHVFLQKDGTYHW